MRLLTVILALPVLLMAPLSAHELVKTTGEKKDLPMIEPVKQDIEGWTVWVDPALLPGGEQSEEGAKALSMLGNHLERIAILLKGDTLKEVRELEIWIEHKHPELGNMQYHPGDKWLTDHGYDPRLVKKVHIPVASRLLLRDQLLKHPAVILHELAHAYHDQVLGFDHKEILAAYNDAMEKKLYDNVLLYTGREVEAYAATNHKEYFAEATEAYLYKNDFYPFTGAELKQHDPTMHALIQKIWGEY